MAVAPETHYAREDDQHVAYQVLDDSGPDLLYVPTATFPIDLMWDEPTFARALRRLASFSRLIACDLIGTGSSDALAVRELPAMQTWTDGIRSVLDAVDSSCTAIFATSESALPAMLFAASYPTRVRALVLWSPFAHFVRTPDQEYGMPEPTLRRYLDGFLDVVGTGPTADVLAPSRAGDVGFRKWWARCERLAAGPGYFGRILELFLRTDMRSVLASIQAPTLVLRRHDDGHVRTEHARAIADGIPDARFVELPGSDNTWFSGDVDEALDQIESFLTGRRAAAPTNRVLSTVLFTDIVGSTERAAAEGDESWTAMLEAHNALIEQHVGSFRGTVVNYTGDGVLATFDGPARAIECGRSIRDAVHGLGLEVRVGLHTGEVEVVGDDVAGIAVHIAARIMSLAEPDQVLVSESMPPLVLGSGIHFEDRGSHALKGVPEGWRVFAVVDDDRRPQPVR